MRKFFIVLLVLVAFTACHEAGPPMGQTPYLTMLAEGASGNIGGKPSLNCKEDELAYGNNCYAKTLLATQCPTASGEYKFVDAITAEARDEINQVQPALSLSKHVGGTVKAVASHEDKLFWSKGSKIYVQGNFGNNSQEKKSQELFSVINSIAVKQLADKSIFVAVGTKQNLQTFNLNASGELTPLAILGRLGEVSSVAIANSPDHIRRAIKEVLPTGGETPSEDVNISLNALPPDSSPSYSYTMSDYVYATSSAGVHRVLASSVGGGCVEEIFRPQESLTKTTKVSAEGNIVAILSETATDSWKSMTDKEKEAYLKIIQIIHFINNKDFTFAFNHLLWPDKVFRTAVVLDVADGSKSANKNGIISDIAVYGDSAYIAATDSESVKIECSDDCFEKAFNDVKPLISGLKSSGIVFKYSADGESQITLPSTSITFSDNDPHSLENWHPAFMRLTAGSDNVYAWGTFGYLAKIKDTPELVQTNGFNSRFFMLPPIQVTAKEGKFFGTFTAHSNSAALIAHDGSSITSNGFKPMAIKISNGNEVLFLNGADKYELFTFSGDNPVLTAEFSYGENPVAFDKGGTFGLSGKTVAFEGQSKFKLKLADGGNTKDFEQIAVGENIIAHDIEITDSNKIFLLARQSASDNKPLYFVYSLSYNGNVLTPSKASKYKILVAASPSKPRFLLTLKDGDDEHSFINAGMILLYPNNPDFDLIPNLLTLNFIDSAADYSNADKTEAKGVALTSENNLIFFLLTKSGATPFESSKLPLGLNDKPISTKMVMSGSTAYLLADFSPTDQRLYKIVVTKDNKIQIEQTYTGTNFNDIAIKDGKLVGASMSNGVEFFN